MPRVPSDAVYELIYRNADRVPGYSRYQTYADALRYKSAPLDYLSSCEESYWGVAAELRQQRTRGGGARRILEIGSGLGYLTFALRQDGFDAIGLDVSSVAVAEATARFGSHYVCEDLHGFALTKAKHFDAVVLTEVIEHVEDPESFVRSALALLSERGALILSTPNKSIYSPGVLWETDPPPVHWWWFSEESILRLASKLRCRVRFTDYSQFHQAHRRLVPAHLPQRMPTRHATFDFDGRLLTSGAARLLGGIVQWRTRLRTLLDRTGLLDMCRRIRSQGGSVRLQGPRGLTLCAILQPQ